MVARLGSSVDSVSDLHSRARGSRGIVSTTILSLSNECARHDFNSVDWAVKPQLKQIKDSTCQV